MTIPIGTRSTSGWRSSVSPFARVHARAARQALGGQVASVILHGSLTLDDFHPRHSDIDLLVVVERPLTEADIEALRAALAAPSLPRSSRVDVRVVTRAVAEAPSPAPAMEAYVCIWPGRPALVERHVQAEPDLVVEFSMCRAHGQHLYGLAPRAVIGPVPSAWVLQVGDRQLERWQSLTHDAAHAELMVLTACRIWRFAIEGVHCSKSEAGRWALARDPSMTAVAEALRLRGGDRSATVSEAGIRRLLHTVRCDIE
ncbi:MAG: DUF4111 domain-containing protein [Dehalococcoidia bacterium]|nr:DUF4111 domain-containing protein [Dehalococcoidia bacterium]